jgi:phage shock protein A
MVTLRIRRLFTAITGHAVTEIEAAHPDAVLDYERTQLRAQVANYNRGLASHAALCERLKRSGMRLAREQAELGQRVQRRLTAGDRERAGQAAMRLEAVTSEREENLRQLDEAEATYRSLVRSRDVAVDSARAKIEALKRSIGEARAHRALAELTEMSSSMQGAIGVCESTLDRVHEKLEEERELAVGRTRVAQEGMDVLRDDADEEDRAARAEEALRRFEGEHDAGSEAAEASATDAVRGAAPTPDPEVDLRPAGTDAPQGP